MEAQFAFLCDGVTPQSGAAGDRLKIEGFHITTVPVTGSKPVNPAMTLVFGFTYSIDESGLKNVEIRLLGPDGTVGVTRDMHQFMGPPAGARRMAHVILDTSDVPIDDFGDYEFSLHVGYELVATVPFRVVAEN